MQHTTGKNVPRQRRKPHTEGGAQPTAAVLPVRQPRHCSTGISLLECCCFSSTYSGFGHLSKSQAQNQSQGHLGQHSRAAESISHWDRTWPVNSLVYSCISELKSAIPVRRQRDGRSAEYLYQETFLYYYFLFITTATSFPPFLTMQPHLGWNAFGC